jgi:hypothetical protein
MKATLIPLRFNELLCRPVIVPFNFRSRLSPPITELYFRLYAKQYNARIQPPARRHSTHAAKKHHERHAIAGRLQ